MHFAKNIFGKDKMGIGLWRVGVNHYLRYKARLRYTPCLRFDSKKSSNVNILIGNTR